MGVELGQSVQGRSCCGNLGLLSQFLKANRFSFLPKATSNCFLETLKVFFFFFFLSLGSSLLLAQVTKLRNYRIRSPLEYPGMAGAVVTPKSSRRQGVVICFGGFMGHNSMKCDVMIRKVLCWYQAPSAMSKTPSVMSKTLICFLFSSLVLKGHNIL